MNEVSNVGFNLSDSTTNTAYACKLNHEVAVRFWNELDK